MARYLNCRIEQKDSGKSVAQIARQKCGISSSLLKRLKYPGGILRNGKNCRTIDTVNVGDLLRFCLSDGMVSNIHPEYIPLKILYEDEDVLLIDKIRGMSMHPSITEQSGTVANAVQYHFNQQGQTAVFHAVNRLDKGTSGLCLIAKHQYAHAVLSAQLQTKILHRRYYAIAHGVVTPPENRIEKPIKRAEDSILRRVVSLDGKPAVTNYITRKRTENYTLLELRLETGRTHQIRVHMSNLGFPLVGDWLYGFGDSEKAIINGQALHSCYLAFAHPVTGRKFTFLSPLPEDMQILLDN